MISAMRFSPRDVYMRLVCMGEGKIKFYNADSFLFLIWFAICVSMARGRCEGFFCLDTRARGGDRLVVIGDDGSTGPVTDGILNVAGECERRVIAFNLKYMDFFFILYGWLVLLVFVVFTWVEINLKKY